MKEIDFLPQWYKAGKRRRINYRRQYIVVAGLALSMLAWNFAAGYSVSQTKAHVDILKKSLEVNGPIAERYLQYEKDVEDLQSRQEIIEKLGQRVSVSSIIAELSYLVGDDIVITRLVMNNNKFDSGESKTADSSIRIAKTQDQNKEDLLDNDLITEVIVEGLAMSGQEVGAFISKLEESPYFFKTVPGYSRNKEKNNSQITEFELSFHVANYIEESIR